MSMQEFNEETVYNPYNERNRDVSYHQLKKY